ncbi:MAG: hypothetical protein HQK99_10990 [Nitrospirae bacterium]|nr:hypothetical protein [Nitrospirota bacterium]
MSRPDTCLEAIVVIKLSNEECQRISLDTIINKTNIIVNINPKALTYLAEAGQKRLYIYNADKAIIYDVSNVSLRLLDDGHPPFFTKGVRS